jgi:hypothetical protein
MQVFEKPKERADGSLPPGSFLQSVKAHRGLRALFRTQHNLTNERSIIAVRKRDAADGLAAGKLWHGLCLPVRLIGQLYPYPPKARASSRPTGLSLDARGEMSSRLWS